MREVHKALRWQHKKKRPAGAGRVRVGRGVIRDASLAIPSSTGESWGKEPRRPILRIPSKKRSKQLVQGETGGLNQDHPDQEDGQHERQAGGENLIDHGEMLSAVHSTLFPNPSRGLKAFAAVLLTPLCDPDPSLVPFQQDLLDCDPARVGDQHHHRDNDR